MNEETILRRENESLQNFVARLALCKDEYDLTWDDIRDICNKEFSLHCSESYYRKGVSSGKFVCDDFDQIPAYNSIKMAQKNTDDSDISNIFDVSYYITQEEKFKARKELQASKRLLKQVYQVDIYKEIADIVSNNLRDKYNNLASTKINKIVPTDNKAILCISDWHYGISINNFKNFYNPDVCVSRVKSLLSQTLENLKLFNVNELYIANLGDLIAGRIHPTLRIESTEGVIKQTLEVTDILIEFISNLVKNGISVNYYWCLDNHSRIEPDKEKSLKDENLVYVTQYILRNAFNGNPNVHIYDSPYGDDIISFNCNGFEVGGCHGDLDKQRKVVPNISLFTGKHYDLLLSAHLHHYNADEVNETCVECNGSLMGTDSYASDLRVSSVPSQNLIIVSKNNVTRSVNKLVLQ